MVKLHKYLLSANIRMVQRSGRYWKLEFAFSGNPVSRIHNKVGSSGRKTLHFSYEVLADISTTVKEILQAWSQMV